MFCYGILLAKKPLGYVQYNLLRNRSKRLVSELKQAILQRDILELWESPPSEVGYQSYMELIGNDLKIWHDAGIHFQVFRYYGDSDWHVVANFLTSDADGLGDWQQESERLGKLDVALKNTLAGRYEPNDLALISGVVAASTAEDLTTMTQLLSEVFPFQSAGERTELAAMLQDDELRQFFMIKTTSSGEDKGGGTLHSQTKQGIWSGVMRLFGRSG